MAEVRDRKDMLLEAGLTLASQLSLPIVLQRIVDMAAQVTDARYGALGVLGHDNTLVEFVTTGIPARQRQAIGALPTGRGVLGLLIHEPRPVRLKNIAEHPLSVGFPAHHPPMRSFLGAPVQALGRVYGNIYLADKRTADEFSHEDEEALVVLATQAGVAIANASLYEEVRARERWLDALRDITNQVLSASNEESLLRTIADHARDLAGADAAVIRTGGGEVVAGKMPADQEPAFQVPLRVPGGVGGTLTVASESGEPFREDTRRLVASLADAASVAIEYDRAQSELRRLGLLEERERIAKELHDGIIQSLFAVGMGLQGAALMAGNAETSARIERAVEELDRVIRDLRNYIFGLRPGILADRQLDQALHDLGEQMEARSREKVDVKVDAVLAAALSTRSADVVQLTREALSNVARHAQATRASVSLEREGAQAVLTVRDNGVGIKAGTNSHGNGMRNMRERAVRLGGTLDVRSAAGRGTTLRISFPV